MLANVLLSETGVLYKDIRNLYTKIEKDKVFRDYELALFILPSQYNPQVAKHYLDKFFGERPYIAFYSNFVGSNDFFTTSGVVGLFLRGEGEKKLSCEIKVFDNLTEFGRYIGEKSAEVYTLFVPYPTEEFGKNFNYFADLDGIAAPITGLFTGGFDYGKSYPVLTDREIVEDGRIAVLSFCDIRACVRSAVNFKKLGPPFNFTATDARFMVSVDGQPAAKFFRDILKLNAEWITAEYLTGFPMLVKTERDEYNKVVRFPKETRGNFVDFWGNLPEKGQFHFVYLLPDKAKVKSILKKHCDNLYPVADLGLFFSCVGKSVFVNPEEDLEFYRRKIQFPFVVIGSYGEIFTYNGKVFVLNGSTTFLLLRD